MTDITLCNNHYCDLRYNCHRYTLKAIEQRQSMATFHQDIEGKCEYYLPIKVVKEKE